MLSSKLSKDNVKHILFQHHAPYKKTKMPFWLHNPKKYEMQSGLRNSNCFDIYKEVHLSHFTVLQFQLFTFSFTLIPRSELHKPVQTCSVLLKITAFEALTNIKLKISTDSLCMQVNLVDFFSCALKSSRLVTFR